MERVYRDGMEHLKEQKKRQEQERLERSVKRAMQEQKMLCYKSFQEERESWKRELRLVEEELERITDQAVSLRKHVMELQERKNG